VSDLAPLPVVIPLTGAAVLLFINTIAPRRVVQVLTLGTVVAEIAVSAALLHQAGSGMVIHWFGGWTPRNGVAVGVSFTIDQVGAGGAVLGGVVVAAALATTSRTVDEGIGLFHALLLTTLAAMAGFCLTGDLFNMFVFFELMAVSAFGLAAYHGGRRDALRAALNFAITNSIGAFLVLIGITLLYARTGALNLAQIGRQLGADGRADRLVVVAVSAVLVGFLIKAAVMPFHFWLIDTASSAPTPLAVILAGVLDTLGVYAVARVYWTAFATPLAPHHVAVRSLLVGLGSISALSGAALSLVFDEPRRRLAFVMVSHTGILLVGVGCLNAAGLAGAAVYAIGDGTVKAALFTGLTMTHPRGADSDGPDEDLSGSGRRRVGVGLLVAGGLALAGLPIFATGLGKAAIEDAASAAGYAWAIPVIILAAAMTGASVLRIARTASTGAPGVGGHEGQVTGSWRGVTVAAAALLGVSMLATTFGRWAVHAAAGFVDTVGYQRAVLGGAHVLLPRVGSPLGWSTGSAAADLAGVVGAVALTAALGTKELRDRRVGRAPVRKMLGVIARLHDGSIGDSAAWATVGTATIAATLALTVR
jgi:multicomponent Na+:H+ antiporter subunit D